MRTLLILITVYGCLGLSSTASIDTDLDDIINTAQDFKKASPEIIRRFTETTCQMISQCCSRTQSKFFSMILLGDTQGLTDQCFGDKGSPNLVANMLSCSPLLQMTTMVTNPDIPKYLSIVANSTVQNKEDMKLLIDTCSEKEIYSISCNWNDYEQQKTCQRKVLQKWAEQGDKIYKDKVQETKDQYGKLIDALKKAFHN